MSDGFEVGRDFYVALALSEDCLSGDGGGGERDEVFRLTIHTPERGSVGFLVGGEELAHLVVAGLTGLSSLPEGFDPEYYLKLAGLSEVVSVEG